VKGQQGSGKHGKKKKKLRAGGGEKGGVGASKLSPDGKFGGGIHQLQKKERNSVSSKIERTL